MTPSTERKTTINTLVLSGLAGAFGLIAHLAWIRSTSGGDAMFWTIMPLYLSGCYVLEFVILAFPTFFIARKLQPRLHPVVAAVIGAAAFAMFTPLLWLSLTRDDLSGGNWVFFSEAGAVWGACCLFPMSLLLRRKRASRPPVPV